MIRIRRHSKNNLIKSLSNNFLKYFFVIGVLSNCGATDKNQEKDSLEGDWYISKNTIDHQFSYQEAYFDGKEVHFFVPEVFDFRQPLDYYFSGRELYFLKNQRLDTVNSFEVRLYSNRFRLITTEGEIEYSKIFAKNTISKLFSNGISREKFESSFIQRMNESQGND
ncbi:hypothetical protein [Flagellimonas pacifica]|uniref:Uncharacterized protein n=1 Tax=Flagellimonas pacifica TaxID=1247520 RepID=A0A285MBB5_9FLAO|nr:hypothetical protein [Allomuricauda parva]SNY94439.1 hypothetical protein SAMN06265377_0097 [Allomuricauda parva]